LVVDTFRAILSHYPSEIAQVGREIALPRFDEDLILDVCEAARVSFAKLDSVIELTSPLYVIGDIHGNLFDLLRILSHTGLPPNAQLLFLGDYVDRGDYSIEVVSFLFALAACYPRQVTLLRGNHEFESMNLSYGFAAEVDTWYPNGKLFQTCNAIFGWLPLVATINNQIYCVHGGISPNLKSLDQVSRLRRPMAMCEPDIVTDMVWSDPASDLAKPTKSSDRGLGIYFSAKALEEFLGMLKMKQMFRAHQCVASGISQFGGGMLYTIFSCSEYEAHGNRCGLVYVAADLSLQLFSLPPVPKVPKAEATLVPVGLVEAAPVGEGCPPPPVSLVSIAVDLGETGIAGRRAALIQKPDGSKCLLQTRGGRNSTMQLFVVRGD
jgi:protein phosphatase